MLKHIGSFKENTVDHDCNCIIDIKNFKDLSEKGWLIDFPLEKIESRDDFKKAQIEHCTAHSFLSVSGACENTKISIINRLFNFSFSPDKIREKKSFSLKSITIQDTKLIVINTTGIQAPVNLNETTFEEQRDTEELIRNIDFLLSDLLILVVNQMTIHDQKYIQSLIKEIPEENNKPIKTVIVIHNFEDTIHSLEELGNL